MSDITTLKDGSCGGLGCKQYYYHNDEHGCKLRGTDSIRMDECVPSMKEEIAELKAENEWLKSDKTVMIASCKNCKRLKAELREVRGMFCHSLAYKDDTIHDKSSALEVAKTFGWDCFEQPEEQGK